MGGRYFLTGVQLGILKAFCSEIPDVTALLDTIRDKQFVGNIEESERYDLVVGLVDINPDPDWDR